MLRRTPRSIALLALALFTLALGAPALAQKAPPKKEPPPDYFPLRVNDWWKYRSTTGDGKQSEFTMKVVSTEAATEGSLYLVEIESAWPIREWYSKPNGAVLWHREAFPKNNSTVSFAPTRHLIKNPLASGSSPPVSMTRNGRAAPRPSP